MRGEAVGIIEDNNIEAVGMIHKLKKRYGDAKRVFNARGKAVLPSFVYAHIHTHETASGAEIKYR